MKLSNKRPGSAIPLQFDITEKHLKNCDSKWHKCRTRVYEPSTCLVSGRDQKYGSAYTILKNWHVHLV